MRVLVFTSLFPNALQPVNGIFICQRVAHFAQRPGNTVEVVAPVPYFPAWLPPTRWRIMSQIPKREQLAGLTVYHPRYFLLPKMSMLLHGILMVLGTVLQVLRLHKQKRFEAIDAHYIYPDGFAAVLLGMLFRIPVIVSARGTDINLFPRFRLIGKMIRFTLYHANGIIAVSSALKHEMIRLGVQAERIRVIRNGVDKQRFAPIERRVARRHLGLQENGEVVISVGALIHTKGHQRVIGAVSEIIVRFPELRLYVIGDGPIRKDLESLICEKMLQGRVFLLGSRANEELKFWYGAADLTCLASSREGLPNVLLESITCGTPVLATRVGGVPEIIVSPELGIMTEPNGTELARDLEFALKKSWNREFLARHGRTRSWTEVADDVERCFGECIASRQTRAN